VQGLQAGGDWWLPGDRNAALRQNKYDYLFSPALSEVVTDAILASRPFDTWAQFDACVEPLEGIPLEPIRPSWGTMASTLGGGDLLRANFDPNSMIRSLGPDQTRWRWVDKSDLIAYSTEGSLGSTGTYRISAVGRILSASGRLLAEASASAHVQGFSLLRQTSQRDFVAGRRLDEYLSLADPDLQCTTGASSSCSWRGAAWGPGQGLGTMTYPCPPTSLPGNAVQFDGSIGLATVELEALDPPAPIGGVGRLCFLHHFDDSWDADAGSSPGMLEDLLGATSHLQTELTRSVWTDPATDPNTLLADGAFLHPYHCPAYRVSGNLPDDATQGDHGVLSYWSKALSPVSHEFLCVRYVGTPGTGVPTQLLGVGALMQTSATGLVQTRGIVAENWAVYGSAMDRDHERSTRKSFPALAPNARWSLVTAVYDTDETTYGNDVAMDCLGVASGVPSYSYGTAFSALNIQKLTLDPDLTFCLGGENIGERGRVYPNSVIDEFAVYDFGDDLLKAKQDSSTWALERYHDGRYYKGNDVAFLSAALLPDAGRPVRLLAASWTERSPLQPRLLSDSNVSDGIPRIIDPVLVDASGKSRVWLELDLLAGGGTLTGGALVPNLSQGDALGVTLKSFRYRVRFRTELNEPRNDPLLETPFLDDVTFAWQPLSGPRILAWE